MGPTFLGIGAQKCGTSWLYRNLAGHPEVWLPPEKELHFFDERLHSELGRTARIFGTSDEATRWRRQVRRQIGNFRHGRTDRSHLRWYARYFLGQGDVDWYRSLFRRANGRVTGDITPDYSVLDDSQIRTAASAVGTDTRLVFLVRSPIERLWSHAKMEERLLDVDADRAVDDLLARPRARALTDYLATLERWTRHFPPEHLFLGFMEDLALRPVAFLDAVCEFLGVSPRGDYPAAQRVVHEGGHELLPVDTARRLADALVEEIRRLAAELGGHAAWWRFCCERLLEDSWQGSALPYPLWNSDLWEDWTRTSQTGDGLLSGPLTAVTARAPADLSVQPGDQLE